MVTALKMEVSSRCLSAGKGYSDSLLKKSYATTYFDYFGHCSELVLRKIIWRLNQNLEMLIHVPLFCKQHLIMKRRIHSVLWRDQREKKKPRFRNIRGDLTENIDENFRQRTRTITPLKQGRYGC